MAAEHEIVQKADARSRVGMSRGDWIGGFAFGLICATIFWLVVQMGVGVPSGQAAISHQIAACQEGNQAQCRTLPYTFDLATGEYEVPRPDQETTRTEYRAEKDLRAQQTMAYWTIAMALFTAIGIYLLWRTLQETQATLGEAKNATKAALDGAAAAWKTEETTREIGHKQSIAYVHVTEVYTPALQREEDELLNALTNRGPRLLVDVSNIGNTVAKYVTVHVEIAADQNKLEWPKFRELVDPKIIKTSNLAPSQTMPIQISADIAAEPGLTEEEVNSDFAIRNVRGIVTYESVFGRKYRTAFIHPIYFRPSQHVAPPAEIKYPAFPFNGPAFEEIES